MRSCHTTGHAGPHPAVRPVKPLRNDQRGRPSESKNLSGSAIFTALACVSRHGSCALRALSRPTPPRRHAYATLHTAAVGASNAPIAPPAADVASNFQGRATREEFGKSRSSSASLSSTGRDPPPFLLGQHPAPGPFGVSSRTRPFKRPTAFGAILSPWLSSASEAKGHNFRSHCRVTALFV